MKGDFPSKTGPKQPGGGPNRPTWDRSVKRVTMPVRTEEKGGNPPLKPDRGPRA